MTLFFDDAYEEVMRKLVEGLRFLRSWDDDWQVPTASALCQGPRSPGSQTATRALRAGRPARWPGRVPRGLAWGSAGDGHRRCPTRRSRPPPDNEDAVGRGVSLGLDAPYPKVKVLGLGECGTHAVIDAHLGGVRVDERELARPLLASFEPDMLVLADRGFYSREFWDEAAATGAQLLWRVQSVLTLPRVTELPDGSYLSVLLTTIERQRLRRHQARGLHTVPQGPTVRVIEYDIAKPRHPQRIAHPTDHHHPRPRAGFSR